MPWYLEAWQPLDGLAFISLRPEDGGPVQFFQLGAPHFQPVPVRGIATALWSARGAFQERFIRRAAASDSPSPLDALPEISFESPAGVRELVRRMFIAHGLLSQRGMAPPSLPPLHLADPPPAMAELGKAVQSLQHKPSRRHLQGVLDELSDQASYRDNLRRLVIAALALLPAPDDKTPQVDEDRLALVLLMEKTGLWIGVNHILRSWMEELDRTGQDSVGRVPRWPEGRVAGTGTILQTRLMCGLLFKIPAIVTCPAPYDGKLPSLGHHFCAGTCDRSYLRAISEGHGWLSLHLSALLLAAGTVDLLPGSDQYATGVLRRANAWLARELPDRSLEEVPDAESTLSQAVLRAATVEID